MALVERKIETSEEQMGWSTLRVRTNGFLCLLESLFRKTSFDIEGC